MQACDCFLIGYVMRSEKCYPTMGKVPDEKYSFSDHEGVAAVFSIRKNITGMKEAHGFFTQTLRKNSQNPGSRD